MNYSGSKAVEGHSLRVSRHFLSSRLTKSLLEKAYASLIPPTRLSLANRLLKTEERKLMPVEGGSNG